MNKKKKRFFPITLAIWPYLCVLSLVLPKYGKWGEMIFWGRLVLMLAVYISNIIYACICIGEDSYYHLAFWNMLIKLIHIPFYLGVFLLGAYLLLFASIPVFLLLILIPILIIVGVSLMITSATYGLNALIKAGMKQVVSTKYVIINSILPFLFIADVISAIVLYIKVRKKRFTQTPSL